MNETNPSMGSLTDSEKALLKEIAKRAVTAAVRGEPAPDPRQVARDLDIQPTGNLDEARGAFVTLTIGGHLRGCIGYIQGVKPLAEAVADNGRSAAIGDPRFRPVGEEELERLEIEVSALTPLRPVAGPEEIRIGDHGVLLGKQGRQAVFLPQVAPEQGWDRETTLTQLALKAGLAPDAWRSGAELQVFEAEVF